MKHMYQCETCLAIHEYPEFIYPCIWCGKEICESCLECCGACLECSEEHTQEELEARFDS